MKRFLVGFDLRSKVNLPISEGSLPFILHKKSHENKLIWCSIEKIYTAGSIIIDRALPIKFHHLLVSTKTKET